MKREELDAKAAELAAKAAAIKAEWQRKAGEGDLRARKLLRDLYPEDYEAIDAAAGVLVQTRKAAPPKPWSDTEREPGEEG